MHNNFHFLRLLVHALHKRLNGSVVSECFSQNKDELIIRFETRDKPFFIKASLDPEFPCLSFPKDFNRARKNSIDLFPVLIGQRVTDVFVYQHERSFSITFTNQLDMIFKLHGKRSNIILRENEEVIALFRNTLEADWKIIPKDLHRTIDWSEEAFHQHQHEIQSYYFTFGKMVWEYLQDNGFASADPADQWKMIQGVLAELDSGNFYIIRIHDDLYFSLVPHGEVEYTSHEPIEALTEFFIRHSVHAGSEKLKQQGITWLITQLKNAENYIRKNETQFQEISQDDHYRQWADLIMANLHLIHSGMTSVSLPDFYNDNRLITIKLKSTLSAQKNAEMYYRKAKNRHIEIEKLSQAIEKKKSHVATLNRQLQEITLADDLKTIQQLVQALGIKSQQKISAENLPYHEFEHMGFRIWVGKNAQRNDELTQKYTYKDDLWLHAKDVPGSHVVIKYQAGKNFPKEVIARAAELAAYNSKRKTDTLCPVVVTPRKFVRKRKGDPPGSVGVEKEEVILVEPKLH
jgi:predicted ribosome quality control (RQC) complex YloA/Tae2 family protein